MVIWYIWQFRNSHSRFVMAISFKMASNMNSHCLQLGQGTNETPGWGYTILLYINKYYSIFYLQL